MCSVIFLTQTSVPVLLKYILRLENHKGFWHGGKKMGAEVDLVFETQDVFFFFLMIVEILFNFSELNVGFGSIVSSLYFTLYFNL